MNSYVVSLIRTWVPIGVGAALTWLATELGVVVDESTSVPLIVGAVGVVCSLYYAAARWLELRWPHLGGLLLALGLVGARTPAYPAPLPPAEPKSTL